MNGEGTLLASGSYQTVKIWSLPDSKLLHTLTGHTDWVNCLVMNQEGTLLASGSNNRRENIKIWSLPNGKLLHTLTGHTRSVTRLVMNQEGTLLASGSNDKTVKLWSLPDGKLLHTLTGHTDDVKCLAMNQQGTLLASGSDDNTIWLAKIKTLYSLCQLPIKEVLKHLTLVEETLTRKDITENQRNWLNFILALANNYRRFQIEVEEVADLGVGEFDIEIEG
jgi:WD40 repeat protein